LTPHLLQRGGSAELSLQNTLDLAKKAEVWGYKRLKRNLSSGWRIVVLKCIYLNLDKVFFEFHIKYKCFLSYFQHKIFIERR
jgi:hypothetical protein